VKKNRIRLSVNPSAGSERRSTARQISEKGKRTKNKEQRRIRLSYARQAGELISHSLGLPSVRHGGGGGVTWSTANSKQVGKMLPAKNVVCVTYDEIVVIAR
jgi:hypothetical protein